MKSLPTGFVLRSALALVTAASLVSGCQKDEAPVVISADQAANQLTNAFGASDKEMKDLVNGAAESLNGNSEEALLRLQALGQAPDLTPDQRRALGESQAAALNKLREAAAGGNQAAAEAVERYRASK
jgi:hypothetical protein